ncbi:unnamed protein product, partial [Brassica oleracea]
MHIRLTKLQTRIDFMMLIIYTHMIMSIMNVMLPTTVWKKSDKKFIVRRLKNVPFF